MAVQHETELYIPLKTFFEQLGYEIKGEVRHCDMVGIRPGQEEPLVVEMKRTFNLALLLQGVQRQKISTEVYVAVERNRQKKGAHNQRWGELTQLCQRLGLGFITVTFYKTKQPLVEVLCVPQDNRAPTGTRQVKSRTSRLMNEFRERSGDYNVGGSRGRKLMTVYREKALKIADAMQRSGATAPRHLREISGVNSTADILQNNYYDWFERVARGKYILTSQGKEALQQYSYIVNSHRLTAAANALEHEDGNTSE